MAPSPSALAENAVSTVEASSIVPTLQPLTADLYSKAPYEFNFSFGVEDRGLELVHPSQPNIDFWKSVSKDKPLTEVLENAPDITQQLVGSDPLDSPHPVPWNWVLTTHAQVTAKGGTGIRYYRSPALVSPDGQYAAYSRIQMNVEPELYHSKVSSVMFLENLKTGELQKITASSPLAASTFSSNTEVNIPGAIAILIPVSWSSKGDRLLARQFEGLFNTSDASDYAVVWDREMNRTSTIALSDNQDSTAVLLGWSRINPEQVLFRAGTLGNEKWPLWAANLKGNIVAATEDQPLVIGKLVNYLWAGPQSHW
ncbi:MAG: hypothetical protein NVS2B14_07590 [Chamaesiphon sp.]